MEFLKVQFEEAASVYGDLAKYFIRDEIRDYADFLEAMHDPAYRILHICKAGTRVGLVGLWELSDFIFIEHIAVHPQYREKGYGSNALALLQQKYGKIILEIEPPTDEDQKRRLNFYTRNGFVQNPYDYIQPSYRKDGNALHLKLMSYPQPLRDIENHIREIYTTVYRVQ